MKKIILLYYGELIQGQFVYEQVHLMVWEHAFLLFHLLDKKIHGSLCNHINLLADGCDWKDCLAGNRRVVKSNDLISRRKCSIFLEN